MTKTVTLELPTELVDRANVVAQQTKRRLEEVLVEWMRRADRSAVEELSDSEVLALCDSQLAAHDQERLGHLLHLQREGSLQEPERPQLEELLRLYRQGMVRKAQALQIAVSRGLRPALG